ncbi:hypothetical protein [Spiroplasma endosymbiont of Nebria brevicollis]|uniref:hypothetical protein n=1 Tax=Spiroplasma endosymbiont of Nebria brevicollis TaxID=3066284 RepID=UPI00313B24C7
MRDIGVRYSHRQSYGLELLSSCYYYGRPIIQGQAPNQINNNEIFEQKVFASRRLFIAGNNDHSSTSVKNNGGLLAGINDKITTNSHPETTFYNLMDAKPTGYLNFKNWKEWLSTSLNLQANLFVTKDFKGMLAFDKTKATNSNGTAIGEAKFFWDSEWNINNISGNYNVDMSSNFKYKDPDTNLIIGSPTVDYSKISQKYMSAILNFNSVVFSSLIQMPYDSVQWLPFALSDIPLIGKLLNVLSLGIPIGFIINQNNQQYKKMLYFNGFMSAFFTNNLENIIGNGGLIPLNAFANENAFAIGKLLGANVSTTAMTMKLTDRISVYPWDPKTGHKLKTKEQISTVDLSQKKNNKVYILAEDTEFLDIASPLTNLDTEMQWNPTSNGVSDGSNYAYIIDTIVTQSLHQGEERHTFYSDNPFTYQGDYNELSVAQFRYKNKGALTNNAFNWTTLYKLNHDEYEESEEITFSYPANILPPSPQNIAKQIVIIPELKIDIVTNNIPLTDTTVIPVKDNANEWLNANPNKLVNYEINLKSLLDPTLLINTFNDLQRYYKNITIYYDYNIETKEEIHDNWIHALVGSYYTKFSIIENFSNPKKHDGFQEIDLKDLIFQDYPPRNDLSSYGWGYNFQGDPIQLKNESGISSAYGITNTNYNLNDYKFSINDNGNVGGWNQNYENNKFLGFCIINNNNLKWNFYLQATLGKIEDMWYIQEKIGTDDKAYAKLYINIIKVKIYKIILNTR